uniref:C-JID domain-containing protein n=1 Tax=Vitis vinifera TaxID=29760 RepID=F6H8W0_VITVI
MKSLKELYLINTAIKDLPDSIGGLESLKILNLKNTAIKDLPNISRLKFLKRLILCDRSDMWEGLISNQLCNLQKPNISQCEMARQIPVLPSSLEEIDAHHCTSKEDLSGLLWLCHRNWLKSTAEELKSWKLSARIPESSGIQEWRIRYQNLGSEVTAKLPMNWYEDPDFLGFFVSCVYQPSHKSTLKCELNLHGNGFEFKDRTWCDCWCGSHGNFKELIDQVWVWWYPKIAIPKELRKSTHINASFKNPGINIKKCGINLIFAGDQRNHMPMLEHPQNSGDNGSASQDTDGNVHGANQDDEHYHIPAMLDLLRNFGDNGSVVLEDNDGNRKRRRDDSLPDVVEEPHYKRLGAPNIDLSL